MSNMEIDIAALEAYNLTNLFCRIADTYKSGLRVDTRSTEILVEAGLVRRTRSRAHLTEYGWSVATRIAALDGAKAFAARRPSHWRS